MRAEQGACVRRRSWASYTINMFEFEFRQGQVRRCPPGRPARTVSTRSLFRPRYGRSLSGGWHVPEQLLSIVPHQSAVEEFEHGLFLRDRLIPGDNSGDDEIAGVVERVEGERQQ
jgi:hypothetical protein